MADDSGQNVLKFGIGQPVPRTEDPRLLKGGGRYTDDCNAPGQVHAVFLRSPAAHGEIALLDAAAVAGMPGVLAVHTGADLEADGIGHIPCPVPMKNRDGSAPAVPPRPALAVGRVRHVGDPVAVVVAETEAQARDAAEAIPFEIAPLPAAATVGRALEADAPQLWDASPGNVFLDFHMGDGEAVEEALASAHHVTRIRLDNTRMVVGAMEPRAVLAQYDAAAGKFTLHVGSQGVAGYRATLANAIFGVAPEKIRVISDDVGGSFGMKGAAYNEAICAMYAARRLGRPVKWCADRSESFLSDHQGRAMSVDLALALDKEGNFLALKVEAVGDMGAYLTAMGPWPVTMVVSRNIISVYRTPRFSYGAKCVFTNTVPTGPYRGAGRPESKYFLELLIDKAAAETGMDRIELRRRNLIPAHRMPFETPVGLTYDSGDFEAVMDQAMAHADAAGFAERRRTSEAAGKLRGLGIAPYLETTAAPGSEFAEIRFEADRTVTLVTGTCDFGMGHATPFAQVLAETLGVPFESIRLVQHDSDEMGAGAGGSGGSRSAIASGGAILEASAAVIERGRAIAGHLFEAAVEDIEFSNGRFRVAGTDRTMDIMDLAAETPRVPGLPDELASGLGAACAHKTSAISFPNGCHVCEVEIDPETGEASVDRYTVVDDFGTVLNPLVVEGQVHGGIAQGLGQVLLENTVYDDDGQLVTGTWMDYAMPRADHMATVDFATRPEPCTTNPLGVKGCGEAGNGGAYPAVASALLDALAGRGVSELALPASPHRVWQALQAAGGRCEAARAE